ncbi:MAG: lysine 2,3-aminomutase, partial [Bacteroidales bacterium]|nr:lysine 2,3-aminomutase [Bacteroidales bacterium]
MIFNEAQQEIANKIQKDNNISNWEDWKWQLKHAIKSLEQFEKLTGIRFEEKERDDLHKTFDKFPLSITPYYLSLINTKNFRYDPVFKQAFGGVEELITTSSELADPLSEDTDSPV